MEPFMELCRSRKRLFTHWTAPIEVELWSTAMRIEEPTPRLLAPLAVGDRLPWRLARDGEPQWLIVIEVIDDSSYRVRYPDGTTRILVDSE
jgi:hypothetical protein